MVFSTSKQCLVAAMINHKVRIFFLLWYVTDLCGITIVYNMRIASPATARQELYAKLGTTLPSIIAGTYVHQQRTMKNGDEQNVNAGLVDYIYSFESFYVRLDAAVGRVHEAIQLGGSTTHTQMDDLLFSAGYRHTATPKLNLAYSFLAGVPTHKDHSFEYLQFGTGHCSVGGQIDGVYSFGEHGTNSLLMALRCFHFFKATAIVPLPTNRICVDFDLGNVFDVFIAYQKKVNKHFFELGYNPSFAFSVSTKPSLGDTLPSSGIRNTWYAAYRYVFLTKKHPMGVLCGASYGFDSGSDIIGVKHGFSLWAGYGINF